MNSKRRQSLCAPPAVAVPNQEMGEVIQTQKTVRCSEIELEGACVIEPKVRERGELIMDKQDEKRLALLALGLKVKT